jgi:hypothetical protein
MEQTLFIWEHKSKMEGKFPKFWGIRFVTLSFRTTLRCEEFWTIIILSSSQYCIRLRSIMRLPDAMRPTDVLHIFITSATRATCSVHPILCDFACLTYVLVTVWIL